MPDAIETVGDILDQRHQIGANDPPLGELLTEETASLKKRTDDLIAAAGRAAVTDAESAGKAAALAKMIADQALTIEKARKERKEPFLLAGRIVDTHFGALLAPLDTARKAVVLLVDGYRRREESKAAAERLRREEEAAVAKREAYEAARAAFLTGSVDDEIEAQEAATKAETVASAVFEVPKPVIDSGLGAKAFGRKVAVVTLTDLSAACAYLIETQEPQVREFVQARFNALARSGARKLPGATVTEDSATSIR